MPEKDLTPPLDAASQAIIDAQIHLEKVKLRNVDVTNIGHDLRRIRERNNFAYQISFIMRGRNDPL